MSGMRSESLMGAAATRLRALILDKDDGAFLGGERDLQVLLGISRTTLRQVARLLEREGVLAVRRGTAGGYYAARPNVQTIEAAVTGHLESLDVRADELSTMASIVWIELARQAAAAGGPQAAARMPELLREIETIGDNVTHAGLVSLERRIRAGIFELVDSPYLQFLFRVNIAFAERRFALPATTAGDPPLAPDLIERWRGIKRLELDAIARGDATIAVMAAERTRSFWRAMPRPGEMVAT